MPESLALATPALRLLSIDEVAVVLRTTRKAVYQLRARGQLGPFVHVGRWGEERLRVLLLQGPPKATKEVPLLKDFKERYIEGYVRANRMKPSGVAAKESMLKTHILPQLGNKRLDKIDDESVQMRKAKMRDINSKTVNNVLCVLNTLLKSAVEWNVIDKMPCRI